MRRQDGEWSGLEEWVATRHVRCRWGARKAFVRDGQRERALDELAWQELDRVVDDAISLVLEATCDDGYFQRQWVIEPEQAIGFWHRAGFDGRPQAEPRAYQDRFGKLHS